MAVEFTRHARRVLRFWSISQEDIIATLENPDSVFPTEKGRLNAIKSFGGQYLRVTYIERQDDILVITVTPRRRPW